MAPARAPRLRRPAHAVDAEDRKLQLSTRWASIPGHVPLEARWQPDGGEEQVGHLHRDRLAVADRRGMPGNQGPQGHEDLVPAGDGRHIDGHRVAARLDHLQTWAGPNVRRPGRASRRGEEDGRRRGGPVIQERRRVRRRRSATSGCRDGVGPRAGRPLTPVDPAPDDPRRPPPSRWPAAAARTSAKWSDTTRPSTPIRRSRPSDPVSEDSTPLRVGRIVEEAVDLPAKDLLESQRLHRAVAVHEVEAGVGGGVAEAQLLAYAAPALVDPVRSKSKTSGTVWTLRYRTCGSSGSACRTSSPNFHTGTSVRCGRRR